ncbi:major facilitator superfamily domain-containing protein [Apiospora hydei]|uniref:Major facilitator superfamily domain-containing protein n=1 Tax=Apiospora hydei TaxID=1337664 RepID=A0ABR1UUN1_9PEZI
MVASASGVCSVPARGPDKPRPILPYAKVEIARKPVFRGDGIPAVKRFGSQLRGSANKLEAMGPGSLSDSVTGDARKAVMVVGEKGLTSNEDSAPPTPGPDDLRPTIPLSNLAQGIVGWESQDDPEMPFNFPLRKKWTIIGLLSVITFFVPFASAVQSTSIRAIMTDLGEKSATMVTATVSIYLLGYVIGPLFLAPLSEIYGRKIVLDASNLFFVVWQIGCAMAPNTATLIVARVVGDLFRTEERGLAMGIFSIGPLFGPTLGPLIGAYLSQSLGWRWDFWLFLIVSTPAAVLGIFFIKETNHRVLVERKTKRLRNVTPKAEALRSCYDDESVSVSTTSSGGRPQSSNAYTVIARGLLRPLTLLFKPLVFAVSLYTAFAYGAYYLLLTTIGRVFTQTYGWSVGLAGLVYLSPGLGGLLGLVVFMIASDRDLVSRVQKNNGCYEPEMRLPLSIKFAFVSPVTFFVFGWAAEKQAHWAVPLVSLLPFTFAMSGIFQTLQLGGALTGCRAYLVDCYEAYSATAVAASAVFRSIMGAALPIAGPKMFEVLGLGWGCSLLGFVCLALVPTPLLLWRLGKRLRLRSKVPFET